MKKDDIPHQAIIEEDEDQNEDKEGKIEIILRRNMRLPRSKSLRLN